MTGAERQREYRKRDNADRKCINVEVDAGIKEMLAIKSRKAVPFEDVIWALAAARVTHNVIASSDRAKTDHEPIDRMHRLLCEMGAKFTGNVRNRAAACWAELQHYRDNGWKLDCRAELNPYAAGTINKFAFEILKLNQQPPSLETIFEALRKDGNNEWN